MDLIAKIIKTVVIENKVPTPALNTSSTPVVVEKATPSRPTVQEVAAASTHSEESKVLTKKAAKVMHHLVYVKLQEHMVLT